jgi:hypothetical protein
VRPERPAVDRRAERNVPALGLEDHLAAQPAECGNVGPAGRSRCKLHVAPCRLGSQIISLRSRRSAALLTVRRFKHLLPAFGVALSPPVVSRSTVFTGTRELRQRSSRCDAPPRQARGCHVVCRQRRRPEVDRRRPSRAGRIGTVSQLRR